MRRFHSITRMVLLMLGFTILFAALLAAQAAAGAGEESYVVQVPLASSLERLEKDKTLPLLEFTESGYALALSLLDDNGVRWVRMVVARGNYFYGACILGVWEELEGLEAMQVDALFQPSRVEFAFTSLPDKQRRGALAMPMTLGGAPALSAFSEEQGIALVPRTAANETPSEEDGATLAERGNAGPNMARLYALVLGLLVFLLAALISGQMFGRKWMSALRERFWQLIQLLRNEWGNRAPQREKQVIALPAHIDAVLEDTSDFANAGTPLVAVKPLGVQEAPLASEGALAGVRIMPAPEQNTLLRRILMKEEAPAAENQEEAMRAFFLGRARLPRYHFLTVGLSNRDALLQLSGESVRPLLAPNPRGQMFSLEEESGNLYLHVEFFAPPSFVLQTALLSVCPERIFACVDADGVSIAMEDAVNHSIVDISPARTVRTEAGFIVTEKGTLVIGRI